MKTIGVRELEEHISEILHQVQETGEIVDVTNDGEIIAHLVPVSTAQLPAEVLGGAVWTDLDRLRAEIAAHWKGSTNAVDALRDVRREL